LVAQIIPKLAYQPGIVSYNTFLEGRILPKYKDRGANVTLVDHYTPFLTNAADPASINASLFATGNHPNGAGYQVMAQTWFGAIQTVLNTPRLVGDYNSDGTIDAADYTFARDRFGENRNAIANRSPANTGVINQDDLIAWQAAYGAPSIAAVPEPRGLVLVVLATFGTAIRRRSSCEW
ncbi:MAG: hypothetical protein AAF266_15720, partial [Planctomycetota bacterium]